MNEIIRKFASFNLDVDFASIAYIKEYYTRHIKILPFLRQHNKLFQNAYAHSNYMSYSTLIENFPILGKLNKQHSFFYPPLYKYLNPTEPQFTKALSKFLSRNQQTCQAFVQAIFSLLNCNKVLPQKGYKCDYEMQTKNVHKTENLHKRIDNIITCNNEVLCIEVKFDASIDHNDLKIYEQQMQEKYPDKNITYVVISINDIQDKIINEKSENWKNIIWYNLLRLWEKNIYNNAISETEDMKRYRSSLWNKILYIGD